MTEMLVEDVLTSAEAASYLRVSEEEVLHLADHGDIPAQRIGREWRFLRRALESWLTYGARFTRDYPYLREFPPWLLDHPVFQEMLALIEKRLLQRIAAEKPERGSKQAVQRHVGVLKDEDDLDAVLAKLSAIRAGKRNGGEE